MTPEIFIGIPEYHQIKIRKMEGFRVMDTKEKNKLEIIVDEVCRYYELDVNKLVSKDRFRKYSDGRQISCFLARELTELTLQDIGTYLGGRDHATMIHSSRKIADRLTVEKKLRQQLEVLIKTIEKRFRNDGLI